MTHFYKLSALAVGLVLNAQTAGADEVWSSDYGKIIYERDQGRWAIWSFGSAGGGSGYGRIYIDGLAGVYSGRGSYEGYWMFYNSPDAPCPTERTDIDGRSTRNHGPFRITFLDPDFPSRWSAQWGACYGPADQAWNGAPEVGE